MKNGLKIPDVVYDGILPMDFYLKDRTISPDYKICVKNNGKINFVVMDAANDFEKFSKMSLMVMNVILNFKVL